ncbi:MAG: NAD(P)-dependent oxidoreductase [Myxococcota bacterium]|nr:NAD(P)-dependent oxidoreductase [Myxococcota bacterium]
MSTRFLMGLDLGGGGVRCLLADPEGGRVVTATRPWASHASPDVPMAIVYDPDATFLALAGVAREALARAAAGPDDVIGIAATSMRHGGALLDAEGHELMLVPNRDARGAGSAILLAVERGAELHRRSGHWPNAVQPGSRLRWFLTEDPETLERAATHLSLSDWIAFRLCGARASEVTQASETGLLEIARREWSDDLLRIYGLPRRIFPELRDPGSPLGTLGDDAAEAFGLRPGIPVAVGGADSQCALLGAGVVAPGQLGIVAGSSAPVLQIADGPRLDDEGRLWSVHHVVSDRWALESNGGGVGEALAWLAGVLHPDDRYPVLRLVAEAERAPLGSEGLLSTLGAEVHDARQMGLPVGNLSLNYLTTAESAGRDALQRAVLEGMACGLRANAEQVERASGEPSPSVRITAGLSRSPFFGQLVADVFARPVEATAVSESTALGAAICAGVGAGTFESLEAGARALVRVGRSHTPNGDAAAFWGERYPEWNALREARAATDATASGFAIRALTKEAAASPATAPFRPRILATCDLDPDGLAALERIGDVEYRSYREAMRLLTGRSLVDALQGVHVFVTEVDVVDAPSLLEAKDLRVIAVCRGDAVNVDVEACAALGIPVVNTPGRNADAVADLAVAYMLALARKLVEANAFLREPGGEAGDMGRMGRAFGKLQGVELWSKTVGLVGLGAVGRKVLARLRPFGARCLVYDPHLPPDTVRLAGGEPVDLDTLLRESRFVSLHAAVTDESRGLLGEAQLARLAPGSFVINTARAALVDEDALLRALESGHVGGAALDVFAVEPPGSDHPLLRHENVIATPHVGGNTREVAAHQGRIVAEELERLCRGERPHHCLDPEVLDGFRWSAPRPEPPPDLGERLGRSAAPAATDLQRERRPETPPAPQPKAPTEAPTATADDPALAETRARMERLLAEFVERIAADEPFQAFAKTSQDLILHFTLTDLGSQFYFGFENARVTAAMGAPAAPAPVQLKLRAALLDGMFTGQANTMQAAMNGELSFSGDTAKAMTLSQVQRDLSRVYRTARKELGDPGDLDAIPRPGSAAPTPAAVAGEAPPAGQASSVPGGDVRHALCRVVDELYGAQLITATGGNVSARCTDDPEQAWITPSQLFKGDLRPEILVRIGMDGRALDPDARSPSSEALMHTAVLKAKPEAQAVIHCHAPNATVLVNSDLPFLPISTEAAFFQNIGRIPFVMPGTQELADRIVEAMADGWTVLMQNHGLLVAGRTLRRAADMAEIIERTCEVILGCYAVGKEPPVLPAKTVELLASYGDLMA